MPEGRPISPVGIRHTVRTERSLPLAVRSNDLSELVHLVVVIGTPLEADRTPLLPVNTHKWIGSVGNHGVRRVLVNSLSRCLIMSVVATGGHPIGNLRDDNLGIEQATNQAQQEDSRVKRLRWRDAWVWIEHEQDSEILGNAVGRPDGTTRKSERGIGETPPRPCHLE